MLDALGRQTGRPGAAAGGDGHVDAVYQLAGAFKDRYARTGSTADTDEAVEALRRFADDTTLDPARRAQCLSSLSAALQHRAGAGRHVDLDELVGVARRVVDVAPADDPHLPFYLASLSNTLHIRFQGRRDAVDLDEAVTVGRRAVGLAPDDERARSQVLVNLCHLLQTRFRADGDPGDLDEAVDAGRRSLAVAPAGNWHRQEALLVTAAALQTRFDRCGRNSADRDEGARVAAELVRSEAASPRFRLLGADLGIALVAGTDRALAAELAETAVSLLPEMASHRVGRDDQQHAIRSAAYLADGAAALVLDDTARPAQRRARRALQLLELGRAVLLGQTLDTRGDLPELRRVHPELAARFSALRERLDRAAEPAHAVSNDPALDPGVDAAAQMSALLARIRASDGFAGFASPPALDELLAEAGQGPIVTFTLHELHSHALLLTADGVTALPLPGLTPRAVIEQANAFHVALGEATDPRADRAAAQAALTEVLTWLWDHAAGPVLDALGYDGPPPEGTAWPRVWWAPSGRLSLLPLHAAGHHGTGRTATTVMDRVVSAYTPTVRALRHARQRQAAVATAPPAGRSLVVAMPTTPGLPRHGRLGHVAAEAAALATLLPDPLILIEPEDDADGSPPPTRDRVLAEMGRPIVHFACHGEYDADDPSAARLLLHDHEERPLTVGGLAAVDLEGAQLAYLSACHTALNVADRLLDESVHLAGACQLAGFPRVVGTLWMVDDEVAVEIAEDFYAALRDPATGTLDLGRAADALHHAARTQRDRYPGTPSLWAAHLYTGA